MRQILALALLCAACASTPPKPAASPPEEPIRSQDEIARDEATSGGMPMADPATCASHPNAPNCPKARGKGGAFDDTAHRNRFVHDEGGNENPLNPAMQSR